MLCLNIGKYFLKNKRSDMRNRKEVMTMQTQTTASTASRYSTKALVVDAMFIALTYIFTAFVNVRLPIAANGGLIHLGNVPLFLCAILLGKRTGTLAGAFGMGLFDLLSGWYLWAPFTFVIVGVMGYTVGAITEKHHGLKWDALSIASACVIKVVGYYIAEVIIYGNWAAPVTSIPGNLVQIGVAAVIVLIVVERLRPVVTRLMAQ